MPDLLTNFPVVIQIPVAWGEMDAFGHVNNIIYFRYFESARIAYIERLGFMTLMDDIGIGPILGSVQCKFKLPVTFPDTVSAGVRVTQIFDDRFIVEHCVVSHQAQRVAAEGEGVIVAYNYRAKQKALLPEEIKQRIRALEQTTVEG